MKLNTASRGLYVLYMMRPEEVFEYKTSGAVGCDAGLSACGGLGWVYLRRTRTLILYSFGLLTLFYTVYILFIYLFIFPAKLICTNFLFCRLLTLMIPSSCSPFGGGCKDDACRCELVGWSYLWRGYLKISAVLGYTKENWRGTCLDLFRKLIQVLQP